MLLDLLAGRVPHLAQSARLLQPAEDLLDLLAYTLSQLIAEGLGALQRCINLTTCREVGN